MAKIKGRLVFGAQIEITLPIAPTKALMEPFTQKAESMVNTALETSLKGALAPLAFLSNIPGLSWLKGAKIAITNTKSKIEVEEVVQ
jgi:hypothetical protein